MSFTKFFSLQTLTTTPGTLFQVRFKQVYVFKKHSNYSKTYKKLTIDSYNCRINSWRNCSHVGFQIFISTYDCIIFLCVFSFQIICTKEGIGNNKMRNINLFSIWTCPTRSYKPILQNFKIKLCMLDKNYILLYSLVFAFSDNTKLLSPD